VSSGSPAALFIIGDIWKQTKCLGILLGHVFSVEKELIINKSRFMQMIEYYVTIKTRRLLGTTVHVCNPSYSGGGDQEDHS
jgi:hypothetical protein